MSYWDLMGDNEFQMAYFALIQDQLNKVYISRRKSKKQAIGKWYLLHNKFYNKCVCWMLCYYL